MANYIDLIVFQCFSVHALENKKSKIFIKTAIFTGKETH